MSTFFHRLLRFYRSSLKRLPFFHKIFYFVAQKMVLPLLERRRKFWTIPDDPVNFRLKLVLRQWEPEVVLFFRKAIRPGMVIIDCGAHVGYHTKLLSELVGAEGMVISFEPHPIHFEYLRKNTENCKNVVLINKAVGDQVGIVTLYDYDAGSGLASLAFQEERISYTKGKTLGELFPRGKREFQGMQYVVEVTTLNDEIRQIDIGRVDVIKLDVEGAEVKALKGANEILRNFSPLILFELSPACLRTFGYCPADLVNVLVNLGYSCFSILCDDGYVQMAPQRRIISYVTQLPPDESVNCIATKGE